MSGKRSPFDKTETEIPLQSSGLHDSLRAVAPRKRNRRWEKQQQSRKAVYRGIDPKLALKVRTIADDLRVPSGEVACALIEYALRSHERGDFDLHPRPHPERMRMTLLPRSDPAHSMDGHRHTSRQNRPEALWRVITTWRGFSPGLKKELATLASEDGLNVPIGELITALLRFGLKAYEVGLLRLEPKPKSSAFTLAHGGKR
jgi:hypothetical protein